MHVQKEAHELSEYCHTFYHFQVAYETSIARAEFWLNHPGAEYSLDVTYAEYNLIPSLTPVQGAKFLRDQYSLGLYEAKRCCDAIKAAHTNTLG